MKGRVNEIARPFSIVRDICHHKTTDIHGGLEDKKGLKN